MGAMAGEALVEATGRSNGTVHLTHVWLPADL